MNTLLVAHDFDETSDRALDEAIALARKLGASVKVVHVYSVPIYAFPEGSAYIPSAADAAQIGDAARRHLDHVLKTRQASSPDVPLEGVLRSGMTAEEICKLADEIAADIIVIGTHGRGVIGRAILGSVAQQVTRQARQPVLSVRIPG
ncbi:universal stress protein [Chondromyces apiculatus]|uniref:Universal stress protein UspA n=1 Tax=Chondromyces apiculatus DSM 436 TaxID=1192034 RepID=A0A017SYU8_9BACT|nr:universal stress protein [Chondromyces apiculatus]EYF02113.1 universal stress protein UspA [Chondromyces apiculatus DSM 436]